MSVVYWKEGDVASHEGCNFDPFDSYGHYSYYFGSDWLSELLKGRTLSFFVNDEYTVSITLPDELREELRGLLK